MKKKLGCWLIAAVMLPQVMLACDICGCGAGNSYIGILPEFQKHIIGLRYRTNSMLTHVGVNGTSSYLTTDEHYNTLEAWGGWNVTNNIRLMASVPYSINEKINQGITHHKNGLGDVSLSGYYQVLNSRKTIPSKLLVQSLWLGGGLKMATGAYRPADKTAGGQSTNLFQLGTGSFDVNLSAMYDVRLNDVGLNINAGFKINTANRYDYQYGNKFNVSAQAYYKFRINNKWLLAPNTGVQFEHSDLDRDGHIQVDVSGGRLLLGTLGIESGAGKFSFGVNWQSPLQQNFANGIVRACNRGMIHFAMIF